LRGITNISGLTRCKWK